MMHGMSLTLQHSLALVCATFLASCTLPETARTPAEVDAARLVAADADAGWLTHGRTYAEQRYSPLHAIDEASVPGLGLAWSFEMGTSRGVEATPLVVDGTLYATGPWSVVYALDAATGEERWTFDPEVPRAHARSTCCGVVNRGVAFYAGLVFVGTLDGRLIGIDATTGYERWSVQTTDTQAPYSITGAPRVIEGLVVIGNGGAEFGVRGYVSAYRAEDGALAWRTYTVPRNPELGQESPALERAVGTWNGKFWTLGGGGTAWDSMAYDPELRLLYVGTGNGSPHARWIRSPGGGDNLYLSSILALRPDTGELVWHFQTTPADTWDYTATQHILLADLEIEGRLRKVLMQAPKNGFFYLLDRETGEFLSGEPYVSVSWATGLDPTGRPIESAAHDFEHEGRMVHPGPFGGHNWQPMSFHPGTGLVYLPTHEIASLYKVDEGYAVRRGGLNTGLDYSMYVHYDGEEEASVDAQLVAWDPLEQRAAWRVSHRAAYNGGTLATAGNLVFQGSADGRLVAYRASDGTRLWEMPVGTGIMAAPITYQQDGEQYVAIAAGWGSGFALSAGPAAVEAGVRGAGRVLAFKLGGDAEMPPAPPPLPPPPGAPLPVTASAEELERGSLLFHRDCLLCHGPAAIAGGSIKDLRYATAETHAAFEDIVLRGTREPLGMPPFADLLSPDEVYLIQQYILSRAAAAAK
jgi:PQQ-dependent dehydrogenase (methanol/ethanol family)